MLMMIGDMITVDIQALPPTTKWPDWSPYDMVPIDEHWDYQYDEFHRGIYVSTPQLTEWLSVNQIQASVECLECGEVFAHGVALRFPDDASAALYRLTFNARPLR